MVCVGGVVTSTVVYEAILVALSSTTMLKKYVQPAVRPVTLYVVIFSVPPVFSGVLENCVAGGHSKSLLPSKRLFRSQQQTSPTSQALRISALSVRAFRPACPIP